MNELQKYTVELDFIYSNLQFATVNLNYSNLLATVLVLSGL